MKSLMPPPPLTGNPDQNNCGFEILDDSVQVVDPCTEGAAVFGPETFARDRGSPQTEDREFTVEGSGTLCVHVANDGAASARITLDAVEIVSPSDFNPRVTQIQKTVPIEPVF